VKLDFHPDPARARALDARMHRELAGSVRHLSEQSAGIVPHDRAALEAFAAGIEAGARHSPLVFADYYDCLEALLADEHGMAEAAFARLAAATPVAPGLVLDPLRDPLTCARSRRLVELLLDEPGLDVGLRPATPEVATAFAARFAAGLDLLERACPELAGEFRAIVREVVPFSGDATRKMQLDGGSHYKLWGALFLNADFHPTPHAIVEVLAHESAHSLLFGFCTHRPLVRNDDTDRFASPLRADARPMDGIYHATFVSARMHLAMSRLLESGLLDAATAAEVRAARDADLVNFSAGHDTVRAHGQLTPLGRRLMDGARDYMALAKAG
jgi:hypothetical protein